MLNSAYRTGVIPVGDVKQDGEENAYGYKQYAIKI